LFRVPGKGQLVAETPIKRQGCESGGLLAKEELLDSMSFWSKSPPNAGFLEKYEPDFCHMVVI